MKAFYSSEHYKVRERAGVGGVGADVDQALRSTPDMKALYSSDHYKIRSGVGQKLTRPRGA